MAASSTQGSKVSMHVQTGFGNPYSGSKKDIRLEGNPDFKTPGSEGTVPAEVFADANQTAKPVVLEKYITGGLKVDTNIHCGDGAEPSAVTLFRAGGYTVASNTDTSLTAYSSSTSFTTATATKAGTLAAIERVDGKIEPALQVNAGSTTFIPAMELSSASASGKEVINMYTITPGSAGAIPGDSLVTMDATFRYKDSSGKYKSFQAQDVATMSVGDLSLEPGSLITLSFNLGASKMTQKTLTTTWPANDFNDVADTEPFSCALLQYADADSSGGISAEYLKLFKATVSFGVTAEAVTGFGNTTCINNLQEWMMKTTPATITLDALYDSTKLGDFTNVNNPDKYIGIIQATESLDKPAFAFIMPNAHLLEAPQADLWSQNEHRLTLKYVARPAGFTHMSSAIASDALNQPWYLGISTSKV